MACSLMCASEKMSISIAVFVCAMFCPALAIWSPPDGVGLQDGAVLLFVPDRVPPKNLACSSSFLKAASACPVSAWARCLTLAAGVFIADIGLTMAFSHNTSRLRFIASACSLRLFVRLLPEKRPLAICSNSSISSATFALTAPTKSLIASARVTAGPAALLFGRVRAGCIPMV